MKNRIATILATCFYCGKLPAWPGTWGSLMAVALVFLFSLQDHLIWLWSIIACLFLIGVWAASCYTVHDAKEIVIDEVVGQLLVVALLHTSDKYGLIFSFFAFRFFDILKPWPIDLIDSKIRNAFGVMFDDILAALYTFVVLFIYYHHFS